MYKLQELVKIQNVQGINSKFNNTTGKVIEFYPNGLLDKEAIYMVKYDKPFGSNTKGMFKESELTLI